jgi:hypothetical protein
MMSSTSAKSERSSRLLRSPLTCHSVPGHIRFGERIQLKLQIALSRVLSPMSDRLVEKESDPTRVSPPSIISTESIDLGMILRGYFNGLLFLRCFLGAPLLGCHGRGFSLGQT